MLLATLCETCFFGLPHSVARSKKERLLTKLHRDAHFGLRNGGVQEGADRADRAPAFSDDLTGVIRMNGQVKNNPPLRGDLLDVHVIGMIDQPREDKFQEVFHGLEKLRLNYFAFAVRLIIEATVSLGFAPTFIQYAIRSLFSV